MPCCNGVRLFSMSRSLVPTVRMRESDDVPPRVPGSTLDYDLALVPRDMPGRVRRTSGNGRSDPAARELDPGQWGDDVRAFCEASESAAIVLGMSFAGRWPWRIAPHPATRQLILGKHEGRRDYSERRVSC